MNYDRNHVAAGHPSSRRLHVPPLHRRGGEDGSIILRLHSMHCQESHRDTVHAQEVMSCVVLQDNSIMASELASFVDAGQLVNSYGPVRFT